MRKYIGALPSLVWGALTVVFKRHGFDMPNGLYYGGLIVAMMIGIMLGVMCHD